MTRRWNSREKDGLSERPGRKRGFPRPPHGYKRGLPRPPQGRKRRDEGGEMQPADPAPKPLPLEGGAEAPLD
jgi:hypothetical protein